ncbi:MAG: glycosyl transferase, family 39 [Acidobacteria bacterium]|nr:glycosyl transferase, family 39 [Acidobacteriota bacterium]
MPRDASPNAAAIALLVIVVLTAIVRIRLLDLPLERDEGEYAYAGQLILDGVPPYSLVYNMKFPGTYGAYAIVMAMFGQTIGGIRFGLLVVNALTTLLLYFLARRLFDRTTGIVAAASHALLSLTITAMGPYAHAMHFVALPAVAAMLLLAPRPDAADETTPKPLRYLAAGALLAVAVLMKQPGATFGLFAGLWLLFLRPAPERTRRLRDMALLGLGSLAVFAALFATLYAAGVFREFWFWTIDYAREYVTNQTFGEAAGALGRNLKDIVIMAPLLWLLALAGAVLLFADDSLRRSRPFTIGFIAASVAAVVPGFYFRPHYFLVMLPAVALLIGIGVTSMARLLAGRGLPARAAMAAFAFAVLASVAWEWNGFINLPLDQITRRIYGTDPFPEAITVARYLKEHTSPDERIAVIGSEPEIYFYAQRKSASGYIYTYALMEIQKFAKRMQGEMMSEVDRADPKYIVMVSGKGSWIRRPGSELAIFEWLQKKVNAGYIPEGVVETLNDGSTVEAWGPDALTYKPKTRNLITVYRRRT